MTASAATRDGLPGWSSVLVVVAHPDDESFGLGAVISRFAAAGASVHVLCFTHGEASTLNETMADLRCARESELCAAAAELGVASTELCAYPDGGLDAAPVAELAGHVTAMIDRCRADGLLVFDESGVTGHPDHQAATGAALHAASAAGLPALAWALPAAVARTLSQETGHAFAGRPPASLEVCLSVDRTAQRRAALTHASQISPGAVLWRRLELLGDQEHLRWAYRPG
ncbi:MAG TPA: PIG-L deacetylase family protein [Streptosporangiaceae bacterium]